MLRSAPSTIAFVVGLATVACAQESDEPADEASPAVAEATAPAVTHPAPADTVSVIWETLANQLGPMLGREITPGDRLAIGCPAKGSTNQSIWGTDVYTDDSSVCVAAVHAGLINSRDGGMVVLEILPGRPEYPATERNGVTSASWGEWNRSFTFVITPSD